MKFFFSLLLLLALNTAFGVVHHGFRTLELNKALLTEQDSTFTLELDELHLHQDLEFDIVVLWSMCTASCPGWCSASLFSPRQLYITTEKFTDALLDTVLDVSDTALYDTSYIGGWAAGYHNLFLGPSYDPYYIYQTVDSNYVLFRITREVTVVKGDTTQCPISGPGKFDIQYILQDDGSLFFGQFPDTSGIDISVPFVPCQEGLKGIYPEGIKVDLYGKLIGRENRSGIYFTVNEGGKLEKKLYIKE